MTGVQTCALPILVDSPSPSRCSAAPSLSQRERDGPRSAQPSGKGEGDYRSSKAPRVGFESTLDAGWDRKLARGVVAPDSIVDLHGLGLQAAYDLLDTQLGAALARGVRMLLLVTGRDRKSTRKSTRLNSSH